MREIGDCVERRDDFQSSLVAGRLSHILALGCSQPRALADLATSSWPVAVAQLGRFRFLFRFFGPIRFLFGPTRFLFLFGPTRYRFRPATQLILNRPDGLNSDAARSGHEFLRRLSKRARQFPELTQLFSAGVERRIA
jgi:hypothetical protein